MASSNRDSLFFPFPSCYFLLLVIFFTCLIVLANTSTKVLSKNGGSLTLFLILKRMHSVFLPLSTMVDLH